MSAEADGTEPGDDKLPDPEVQRKWFAERLREADVSTQRFIDVHDGAKGTWDHTRYGPYTDELQGNYGVYAGLGADSDVPEDPEEFDPSEENVFEGSRWMAAEDVGEMDPWLVDVDVDNYKNDGDEPTAGLESLPETFTIESPHTDGATGGHRYYAVHGHVATALEEATGAKNPVLPWGEVRVHNQYVVGPGSQIQPGGCEVSWCDGCKGCDNNWCDECAKPDGGYYRIAKDREIAVLDLEEFVDAVIRDLDAEGDGGQGEGTTTTRDATAEAQAVAGDVPDYEPDPDASLETVLSQHAWMGTYLALGPEAARGDDDRSTADWALIKEMICACVPEVDVYELLSDSPYTKVDAADAADNYWDETWSNAVDVVAKECRHDDKPIPWVETDDDETEKEADDDQNDVSEIEPPEGTEFADVRPEPLVDSDGNVWAMLPVPEKGTVTVHPVGKWQCQRCGFVTGHQITIEGDMLDEPHTCYECERNGPFKPHPTQLSGQLRAFTAPIWRPPQTVETERLDDLWDDTREYIRQHWIAPEDEEHLYDGLTAFAISTWLRPALKFVPHAMILGRWTGGKTRLLNTLDRVSYHSGVFADTSPAAMFRLIDRHDATPFISEYHGMNPDARQQLDNIIRAGQKRGEKIPRCVGDSDAGGYDVSVFDPFTHVAVATQFEPEDDIVSRCIQIRTTRPSSREAPAEIDEETGQDIRNRMLYARLCYLDSDDLADAETKAYGYLAQKGIVNRLREKLLGILTVAELWDKVDEIEPFVEDLQAESENAERNSVDAQFIEAVRDLTFEEIGDTVFGEGVDPFAHVEVPLSDVVDRYNEMTGQDRSPSWAGHVRARHGLGKNKRSDGTVISDPDLGKKLRDLCDDFGLGWERLDAHDPVQPLPDDKEHRSQCSECGKLEWLAHKHATEGYYVCGGCASEIRAAERKT